MRSPLPACLMLWGLSLAGTAPLPAQPLWQGEGRIVISSDGNEHDHDDWAATPLSLALLAARGLQDRLVVFLLTGTEKTSPADVQQILENPKP